MTPLFYVAMVLCLSAIAVTAHALLSAPEGYEDGEGFHPLEPRSPQHPASSPGQREEAGVRTFFSAR